MEGTKYQVGQYVRHTAEDRGTGKITTVRIEEYLRPSGKIGSTTSYAVKWLDLRNEDTRTPTSWETDDSVQLSARNVPKFTSVEEAEAWIEKQSQPGNWVDKVDDLNATASDVATRVRCACGTIPCDCRGCITINDEHIKSDNCHCEDTGCECC